AVVFRALLVRGEVLCLPSAAYDPEALRVIGWRRFRSRVVPLPIEDQRALPLELRKQTADTTAIKFPTECAGSLDDLTGRHASASGDIDQLHYGLFDVPAASWRFVRRGTFGLPLPPSNYEINLCSAHH